MQTAPDVPSLPSSLPARKEWIGLLKRLFNRLLGIVGIVLCIAYVVQFGLIMAERGRASLPARPLNALATAFIRLAEFIFKHPLSYTWHKIETPALQLVLEIMARSAVLLLISLLLAVLVGVMLGMLLALKQGRLGSSVIFLLSILGISTPSFLLAMLMWIINFWVHRRFGIDVLPPTGFGWDAHLIMPTLVLSARPLAQITQVTYITLKDILNQDYITTAHAKGLSWRLIRKRHMMRNALIPIMTAAGTSLRFSLASLPVVETFFLWPGVGLALLQAIEQGAASLVTDLVIALGVMFLFINLVFDFFFPLIDPRLQPNAEQANFSDTVHRKVAFVSWLSAARQTLLDFFKQKLQKPQHPDKHDSPIKVIFSEEHSAAAGDLQESSRPRHILRRFLGKPAFLFGSLLILFLLILAVFGESLSPANPYVTNGVKYIEGELHVPPFPPSSMFPWGSDALGRDLQALVLSGGRRTLTLAFFGMLARLLLGTALGMVAGWKQNSWADRLISSAIAVWAALPLTIFAMLIIQALGIQQGMWVFIVAISVVGWGEVAQFVRSQVIALKPSQYIESARSIGSTSAHILSQHIFPNISASLLSLAALEMGGILMLLAELGYLNIFMGGGFRMEISVDTLIAHYSDVPEWAALLANIRTWWRSYPWMAWFPGAAFFIAIIAFNLFGEGLRQFLEEFRINVRLRFNRITALAAGVVIIALLLFLYSTSPLGMYRSQSRLFDEQAAFQHISQLASPAFQGRESDTPASQMTAEYIAKQMAAIGLNPGGSNGTYFFKASKPRRHLDGVPVLKLNGNDGQQLGDLAYRTDYLEAGTYIRSFGEASGEVVALIFGPTPEKEEPDAFRIRRRDLTDEIVLVFEQDIHKFNRDLVGGILMIPENPEEMSKRRLYSEITSLRYSNTPIMYVSAETASRLLASTGRDFNALSKERDQLSTSQALSIKTGAHASLSIPIWQHPEGTYFDYYVIGFLPGSGAFTGSRLGEGMDKQVIMVSAYYDGPGIGPDGTFYPGANDNASGVATMLEIARALKQSPAKPKKTVMFVAWSGGDRNERLDANNAMNAKTELSLLNLEALVELSGVGGGSGQSIAISSDSSYRLVQLFQKAAERFGIATTTRGRGPHYGVDINIGGIMRKIISLHVSWDGSDQLADTPKDTLEHIDPRILRNVGRVTLLCVNVMANQVDY